MINPYLLHRNKADVASQLPKKTEQVLFCLLTQEQRRRYEEFLESVVVREILEGKRHVLYGIDFLRKICNHPDLVDRKKLLGAREKDEDVVFMDDSHLRAGSESEEEDLGKRKEKKSSKRKGEIGGGVLKDLNMVVQGGRAYGATQESGKLQVVKSLLPLWKDQGHRVLLFCQTRQMLDIVEKMVFDQGLILHCF